MTGIKTDTIIQSEFCHFETVDGRLIMVNTKNVLMVEVFTEDTQDSMKIYQGIDFAKNLSIPKEDFSETIGVKYE